MTVEKRTVPASHVDCISQAHLDGVHAFTAHFYKKLTEVTVGEKRKRPASVAHSAVARWTKNLDLFSKR